MIFCGGSAGTREAGVAGGSPPEPSLDFNGQNCTLAHRRSWDRKRRRAYHRILSGIRRHKGERLRFLTLTSSPEARRPITKDFRVLKERIRRLTPLRLVRLGYLTLKDCRYYYGSKPLNEPLRFDYFWVETSEGNGVLHILYFGDYIPQKWLSDAWRDIHQSPIVDIRATKSVVKGFNKDMKRLAVYCVVQYCAEQDKFIRYGWGWGWVFRGFVRVWELLLKHLPFPKALKVWNMLLERGLELGWMWVDVGPPSRWLFRYYAFVSV